MFYTQQRNIDLNIDDTSAWLIKGRLLDRILSDIKMYGDLLILH